MYMTDFAAGAVGSDYDMSVNDNAAADTGSKSNCHQIGVALTAALPHFTESSHIGIVGSLYRKSEITAKYIGDIEYIPADIYGATH